MMDLRTKKTVCRELLRWYRNYAYLENAESELGQRYRKFDGAVKTLIDDMPKREQELYRYYYFQRLDDRNSARMMGISIRTFYKRQWEFSAVLSNMVAEEQLVEWEAWVHEWSK